MAKTGKKKKIPLVKGPVEWIYEMGDYTMREMYRLLRDQTDYQVELWEDAGVMEISMTVEGNIDMEQSEEEGYLWVTLSSKGYDNARNALKVIESVCGGHFEVDE